MILVCDTEHDQPVFGKIDELIVTPRQECLFMIIPLTASKNHHYHSYEVTASSRNLFFIYRYYDFVDYYPLNLSMQFGPSGELSVCLKYHVLRKM